MCTPQRLAKSFRDAPRIGRLRSMNEVLAALA